MASLIRIKNHATLNICTRFRSGFNTVVIYSRGQEHIYYDLLASESPRGSMFTPTIPGSRRNLLPASARTLFPLEWGRAVSSLLCTSSGVLSSWGGNFARRAILRQPMTRAGEATGCLVFLFRRAGTNAAAPHNERGRAGRWVFRGRAAPRARTSARLPGSRLRLAARAWAAPPGTRCGRRARAPCPLKLADTIPLESPCNVS